MGALLPTSPVTLCPIRCVRITDTGLSYLSTMSSLRSLYLRWCCQVGGGHGCALPGWHGEEGRVAGTGLETGHKFRVGSLYQLWPP